MFRFQRFAVSILIASPAAGFECAAVENSADSHCIHGPDSSSAQPAWLQALRDEREAVLQQINWAGGVFENRNLTWTQTSYIQPQMHPYDRFFYDPETKEYTVTKFLDDLKKRYGGIDSVLIWPTYPLTGIDDRNQFDFFRALPGGLDGVAKFIGELHAAGVKVLQPNKPWDTGTRQEPLDNAHTLAALLKQTGADGINGDTMSFFPKEFWDASVAVDHPLALEPEAGGTDLALNWSTMGWGYFGKQVSDSVWQPPKIPVVDRFKFITRGKFMTNVCNRWAQDHTNDLQMAWFNGDGFESWENVWGVWNGITPRDGEATRRVGTMLRFFGKHRFLQSPYWEPHSRGLGNHEDIFASKWSLRAPGTGPITPILWTIVNRGDQDLSSELSTLEYLDINLAYWDCYHGVQIQPFDSDGKSVLRFDVERGGYGCLLQLPTHYSGGGETWPSDFQVFNDEMASLTQAKLSSYSNTWTYLQQSMVSIPKVGNTTSAPEGTVFVPRAEFTYDSLGLEIEGTNKDGVDVQYPWEPHPMRNHSQVLDLGPFYIDKFPVTAAKYSSYLKDTDYKPRDPYNWLKTWNGSSEPPAAVEDLPVTHVSLEEARAYCAWSGGRLPHSYEWQYAAQGTDGRVYPWGNADVQDNYPVETTGHTHFGPEPVTAHSPAGDSPFGMADVVGNVWQYTDEFHDAHTRSVVLKGGSNYRPSGSFYYFWQAKHLNFHNKYMLFDESFERASTVGFRCLVDAADSSVLIV